MGLVAEAWAPLGPVLSGSRWGDPVQRERDNMAKVPWGGQGASDSRGQTLV